MRHPVTDAPEGLCYGRTDLGWGKEAAAQVQRALATVPKVAEIWSSPLTRCIDLAERFGSRDGAAATTDHRLIEHDFGRWEGRLWADIPRSESEPWIADIINSAPPGGEAFAQLLERVAEVISEIPEGALVITHAGVIRAARMHVEGISFDTAFAEPVPFAQPLRLAQAVA